MKQTVANTKIVPADLATFKPELHGKLILPNDPEYDEARKVWNGMIDKHPALIARCADVDDVVCSVRFARNHDLLVAVRGGGHNVAGFGTCDGGMVIDLSLMKQIEVDTISRTARAQGGLTWGEFDKATQEHGLATTGGLVSTTGIAGFTLGGGIGWLMRKHGLALDNLLSVEIVTANGQRITVNENENAELFWGVRGGGGNFGIVTEFTYQLHLVGPNIFGGAIFHPLANARELLQFYRTWVSTLPDEMTTMVAFLTAPPAPFVPSHLQGTPMIAIALCHIGAMEQGAELAKPLLEFEPAAIDLLGPHPYIGLQGMFDASAPKGILSYWKSEYLRGLEDDVIDMLVEGAMNMRSPFSAMHIHHMEGAVNRAHTDATAFEHRDASFILNIIGEWMGPMESDSHIAWVRETWQSAQPYATGAAYLNFLDRDDTQRVKAAYGTEKYARLVALKNKYDPANLFHLNQNISPHS
jgi:FAD/FMN-containing dehydrogenase